MRKIILGVVVLAILAVVGTLLYRRTLPDTSIPQAGSIRVAVILSLTGSAAQFDAVKRRTLAVAEERLAAVRPGTKFDVKVYDAGTGADTAIVVARQAIREGAQIILSGTSPNALAIASVVRSGQRPIGQLANAANPQFGPPRTLEYRLWPDWNDEAREIAALLQRQGWTRVLVVNSSDPYSTALEQALRSRIPAGTSLRQLSFDPASAPDFRPALLRAKTAGTDAVILFGLPPGMRSLIGQLSEVRWTAAVIGGVNINLVASDFRSAGLRVPVWSVRTTAMQERLPVGTEPALYRDRFMAKYGEAVPFHALYLADGIYFSAAAAGDGGAFSPNTLQQVTQFQSASGPITVDKGVLKYRVWSEQLPQG